MGNFMDLKKLNGWKNQELIRKRFSKELKSL